MYSFCQSSSCPSATFLHCAVSNGPWPTTTLGVRTFQDESAVRVARFCYGAKFLHSLSLSPLSSLRLTMKKMRRETQDAAQRLQSDRTVLLVSRLVMMSLWGARNFSLGSISAKIRILWTLPSLVGLAKHCHRSRHADNSFFAFAWMEYD